jgi:ATP-dependent helicase/nuclease subunit B
MVLRRLLERRREQLKVFRRSAGQPGFADTLARALGEMKTYCIGPEELAGAASGLRGEGDGPLADKLADLHLLYRDLEDYLADRFTDPDDYLNLLADRLEMSGTVRGTEVWVDGFTGFTPQEYRVLAALLRAAGRVNVTLCAGAGDLGAGGDETDLFYPVRETYNTLCEMAARERVTVERPLALDGRRPNRFRSPGITCLERYYFDHDAPSTPCSGEGVTLAAAANPLSEVEGVAREITALCRDGGYRYRDIVVLLRDLESYAHLIARVFADHGIPVFIDQKRTVPHHPLVELVRSALEVAAGDWPHDSVFRFLKTDLAPLAREEADLLENYVLAHGIRGGRWTDGRPWEYVRSLTLEEDREKTGKEAEELAEINRIRNQAAAGLAGFCRAAEQARNVREMTAALWGLLEQLAVPEQLDGWSLRAAEEGNTKTSWP